MSKHFRSAAVNAAVPDRQFQLHRAPKRLRQQRFDDFAVDVGEAVVAALEAEGEFGVVEAEEVEDGGVEVVDVDFVFDGVKAELVGLAVSDATFDAAAGEPDGVAVWMMVTANLRIVKTRVSVR